MIRNELQIVPKPMKTVALVSLVLVPIFCFAGGLYAFRDGHQWSLLLLSAGFGAIAGCMVAAWFLGLGYVWADASRRNMRRGLWLLIVLLVPHLIGFLLYLALRQPLTSRCPQCGMPVAFEQRFCPTCGHALVAVVPVAPQPVVPGAGF